MVIGFYVILIFGGILNFEIKSFNHILAVLRIFYFYSHIFFGIHVPELLFSLSVSNCPPSNIPDMLRALSSPLAWIETRMDLKDLGNKFVFFLLSVNKWSFVL